ncbi:hypothetical protein QR680_011763 [Steinernema hermaphroditum]|uniref:C-type lectin domain-containing protein n=1 Tax=Steinernema hermaphroditum TaxID=289476 RepID=A0AA39HZN0_9BILA|nr:hypothetical protein QR680_011763 [Steinernema hermaphroditum]
MIVVFTRNETLINYYISFVSLTDFLDDFVIAVASTIFAVDRLLIVSVPIRYTFWKMSSKLAILNLSFAAFFAVAGELYVRTLPKTLNFDGKVTMTKTATESVKECIHEWYSKPIHGVNFDENTKVCYGLEKIYKTKPSTLNRISYLLNRESGDVCTNNLTAAVNEAIKKSGCRDGWYQLTFGAETYCYYSMPPEEYNQTADTSSVTYKSTIVPACKKLYPFSNAASIHSLNESEALRRKQGYIIIGLKPSISDAFYDQPHHWKWDDGTPLDFADWNPDYCQFCTEPCGFVVLWRDHDSLKRPEGPMDSTLPQFHTMHSLVLFTGLFVFVSSQGTQCPTTGGLTPADRDALVDAHNKLRSSNARGLEQDGPDGGNAPTASNMYQLSYSCDLEAIAQSWAENCQFEHSPQESRNAGENIYATFPVQNSNSPALDAPTSWWSELAEKGVGQYSSDYTMTPDVFNAGTGHYTQMAWGATTEFGCGIAQCTEPDSMTFVVCNYRIQGNMMGDPIYQIGDPCSQDSDCTTYAGSTCNTTSSLCIQH